MSDEKYVPDYDHKCSNCEQSPVVTIKDGNCLRSEFDLCGPCLFGESSCIDPEEWNRFGELEGDSK